MDAVGRRWWTAQQQECPVCAGTGVPVVLDMQDAETAEAVRTGLAELGGCGLGGARYDYTCRACQHRWAA